MNESSAYIDLHSHTDASDGSLTPQQLVQRASEAGLSALAITDHDTFAGYEQAIPHAHALGLDLVQGIELNSRLPLQDGVRYVHLLAYFVNGVPAESFAGWLEEQRLDRQDRNRRLVKALQERGIEIHLEEVESVGRSLTGRPHFARILVAKGYASDADDAFRRYIGESVPTYVERQSPPSAAVVAQIREAGGIPVVAHPVRLNLDRMRELRELAKLKDAGLLGLEVRHSDQSLELQEHYRRLANDLSLIETGGSDFHGAIKPDIELGSGRENNVRVPAQVLDALRASAH